MRINPIWWMFHIYMHVHILIPVHIRIHCHRTYVYICIRSHFPIHFSSHLCIHDQPICMFVLKYLSLSILSNYLYIRRHSGSYFFPPIVVISLRSVFFLSDGVLPWRWRTYSTVPSFGICGQTTRVWPSICTT